MLSCVSLRLDSLEMTRSVEYEDMTQPSLNESKSPSQNNGFLLCEWRSIVESGDDEFLGLLKPLYFHFCGDASHRRSFRELLFMILLAFVR